MIRHKLCFTLLRVTQARPGSTNCGARPTACPDETDWSLNWAPDHCWLQLFSLTELKGIVHPKMKSLSSFSHPQVVTNLYECLCSAEHKGRYSEECGKQSNSGAPLTSIVFFFLLWKSMVPQNSLVTNFLQNIFLCVRQNKETLTGLELLEGE